MQNDLLITLALCSVVHSAVLNSAGGMGDGGLSPPEEGVAGQGAEGGNGHKAQVSTKQHAHTHARMHTTRGCTQLVCSPKYLSISSIFDESVI